MSDWEDRRLGDCVQMLSGGTPSKANADYWNGHIPWVSAKDLKSFFLHDTQDHITQEAAQNGTKIAPENSILILVRGMTLHNDLPIGCPTRDMAFNQDVKAIIADKNLIESKYLAYWLLANKLQLMGLVESASHGTGRINTDDLKSVIISYPDLKEQKQILGLLGNFDHKIENLRRQNETLEAITQTLFKHWFVDFEFPNEDGKPYKSSGGAMVRSDVKIIPAGWRVGKLGEVVNVNAKSISNGYKYTNIEYVDISSVGIGNLEGITSYPLKDAPSRARRLVTHGDVIWSGVRPNRKSYLFISHPPENLVISTGFITLTPILIPSLYLYAWVTTDSFVEYLTFNASGSAYPAVKAEHFEIADILLPEKPILNKFHSVVEPMREKIHHNALHIKTLTKTRDVLLPQLMSGKLPITE